MSSSAPQHGFRRHLLDAGGDETGIANIIVRPKIFEAYRRIVHARLLGVRGQLQSEQGVIHVVACKLFDMSGIWQASPTRPAAGDFLSSGDEVRRPIDEDRRIHGRSNPRATATPLADDVLPKGCIFVEAQSPGDPTERSSVDLALAPFKPKHGAGYQFTD